MSKGGPKVTVMMPAYNAEKFIRTAIESVLKQDFKQFELVIIDDCSTDNTYHIAKEYIGDARVRVYRNHKRKGNAKTRNRILRLARGSFIAPHDADDIMLRGRLKDHCRFLEKHPNFGVVFGKGIMADERLKSIQHIFIPPQKNGMPVNRSGLVKKLTASFNHGTAMIRKKLFLRAGFYEAALPLGADSRLMRRIFQITPFYFLNKCCFVYRRQSRSLCRSRLRENRAAMGEIFGKPQKKAPQVLTFFINGEWIRVNPKGALLAKTLRWRLNFYAWQAEQQKKGGHKRFIDLHIDSDNANLRTDAERFREGFLRPLSGIMARKNKVILTAGLVSDYEKGILVVADESVRSEAILSFLDREFYYYSSCHPILYKKRGRVYGQAFVDPLIISKPIMTSIRSGDSWGQFWNPSLRKHCLNVYFYRTYLIGNACKISTLLFIQRDESSLNIRARKLNLAEAKALLKQTKRGPFSASDFKTDPILENLVQQARSFLIKSPQARLKQAISAFEI